MAAVAVFEYPLWCINLLIFSVLWVFFVFFSVIFGVCLFLLVISFVSDVFLGCTDLQYVVIRHIIVVLT